MSPTPIRAGDVVRVREDLRGRPMFPTGPARVERVEAPRFGSNAEALIAPIDEGDLRLRSLVSVEYLERVEEEAE